MEPIVNAKTRILRVVLIISILVNVTMAIIFVSNIQSTQAPDNQYLTLTSQNQNLTRNVESLKQELTILQSQLSYYKAQAEYYSRLSRSNGTSNGSTVGNSEINIVAVREVTTSTGETKYDGIVLTAHLELRDGVGRLLINTRPKIGIDLQTSANTAILIAENVTGRSLRNTDVILTVTADSETDVLDGPSAGGAITVALIAAINNRPVDPNIFMTGTINPDGTVGKVGGVLEKALAAARFGAKRFVVPEGQSVAVTYQTQESHPAPGLTIITTKPESINVQEYLSKEGYNLRVLEVGNITNAYNLIVSQQ
jgi:uncharacterized protein